MMDSKRELPTGAVDLVIRFASSVSDLVLTIPHPESTSALSLKQLIRPHLPDSIASNRLRLISAGKVLVDNKAISDSITIPQRPPSNPAPDPKGKGKAAVRRLSQPNPRVYIHCSIGDALSASDLAAEASASSTPPPTSTSIAPTPRPAPTPARPPRGFDRLLDSGFGPEDVAALRTQFLAIQAHTHTPDTMPTGDALRALEDRWLDDDMGGAAAGGEGADGPGGDDDAGLEDMLWGNVMGFFWPVAAVCWLMREEGVWPRRRQVAVLSGMLVNLMFGFLRLTN